MDKLPHIFLPTRPETQRYTSTVIGRRGNKIILRDRAGHGQYLRGRFETAWDENNQRQVVSVESHQGVYLEFVSDPNGELVTKSLENMGSKKVRLLNVRTTETDLGETVTLATVYVSHDQKKFFIRRLEEYLAKDTAKGNPKHQTLINSISDIKSALLVDAFWTDSKAPIPVSDRKWVEVWFRGDSEQEVRDFEKVLRQLSLVSKSGVIKFPERIVKLIFANSKELNALIEVSDLVAEFRLAKTTSAFFMDMPPKDQVHWLESLQSRIHPEYKNSAVCILDTGVNNGHPLLTDFLNDDDCQTVDSDWGEHDHYSHGTLMAGTSLYGDLTHLLESDEAIAISHVLESVKILPLDGTNEPEIWGYITAQGVSLAEIQAPGRKRIFCMAVTATDTRDMGRPSSWSAQIDQLSAAWQEQRLFIISAGNSVESIDIKDAVSNYPKIQVDESVHDPAQSWNALTVGAITSLTHIQNPDLASYQPIAAAQTLSPFSTTSDAWEDNKWPIKPELVLEGGNLAMDVEGFATECDGLSLLSTSYKPDQQGYFYPFNMTSAAAAQLARMAGILRAQYPDYWEETIRALLIHSADWPEPLKNQFMSGEKKTDYQALVKICGYGVPNLDKAQFSAKNSLALIAEAQIQPFHKEGNSIKTCDMHFYELLWPVEVLQMLPDDIKVRMKLTLSYFIEPGPGEIGWKDRYRYASHALRFDVNSPGESKDTFVKRINKAAREEDENLVSTGSASDYWTIGSNGRDRGSVHSDTWNGTAAALALSNMIAVMPKIGWWKERSHLKCWDRKTRYSLVASIEVDSPNVDVYTPIATKLKIPIAVKIS